MILIALIVDSIIFVLKRGKAKMSLHDVILIAFIANFIIGPIIFIILTMNDGW